MSIVLRVISIPDPIDTEHIDKWVELFLLYWEFRFDNPEIILAKS